MGEMNAWNPNSSQLEFDGKFWKTSFYLEPGIYQYLLVLDGKQQLDPSLKDSISNNIGGFNSFLTVGEIEKSKIPYLFTKTFKNNKITIGTENSPEKVIVFYQNYELDQRFVSVKENEIEIKIPSNADNFERSYIRVWSYNEYGVSNDIKIPLQKGKVVENTNQLKRSDYETAIMYNVFVDRFYDGDESNNRKVGGNVLPPADYHGGDIAGVIEKINEGYFDKLGINTIWLSPIVKNVEGEYGLWKNPRTAFSAYHGYWPISFTEIDDRMGTRENFKEMVDLAHSKQMNVLVDYVAHHVHEQHPVYLENKNWATDLILPDGSLNTERWDDHRLTTWFDIFLPTLDNSIPEVYEMISDSAVYWITEYGIDGFRHDAAKHVPLIFWSVLTKKIKEQVLTKEDRVIYQIGETYGTPELIGSYVNSGMLDAQFDFNLYDAISTALAIDNSFSTVENTLNQSLKTYGWHNLMGNITGNQDRGRFISYATGTLKFDEDAKLAGWTREITVGSPVGYDKMAMLMAFINTIPGIPVIYYGDEIGMPGGNDPDNRRMMRFDMLSDNEVHLWNTTAALNKLRRSSMALTFGNFKFLKVEDDIMVYQRTYFNEIAVVFFNKNTDNQTITVEIENRFNASKLIPKFSNEVKVSGNTITVELKPYSFEILMN
ncbi:MAG TPA: alpha-amlyase [Bacteroidetes bacterium]|nr:alpha-amlyase [Bacteroidota bacterium]